MFHTVENESFVLYDRTLVVAIELSSKPWGPAAQGPSLPKSKAKNVIAPRKFAFRATIDGYRARPAAAG